MASKSTNGSAQSRTSSAKSREASAKASRKSRRVTSASRKAGAASRKATAAAGRKATAATRKATAATFETNEFAGKATNVALGAPVAVADLVNQAIERWRDSEQRDKDIKVLRDQIERGVEVVEEKGVTVREQITGRIEPSLTRVQDEVRERGGKVRERRESLTSTAQEQLRKTQERVRNLA